MSMESVVSLVKAMEAGNYNAAPTTLVQGAALQVENLDGVMQVVTFEEKALKLQKGMEVESCKATLAQFDRVLGYGIFGGAATIEGGIGEDEDSSVARIGVPMAYYSHTRRVTDVANMVATVDGVKADDRSSRDAAIKIAADMEFDMFRGKSDFSNAGVFDGNAGALAELPNILGVDAQVRMSDVEPNAQDQMFSEYGGDESVVVNVGGPMTQDAIEDAHTKSVVHHGEAEELLLSPTVLATYNKISFGKERIMLGGSPQDATSADLKRQWVSGGTVKLTQSIFLMGKTSPAKARKTSPSAPTAASAAVAGTTSLVAGSYTYFVTSANEHGESIVSSPVVQAVAAADQVNLTITSPGGVKYFNVYRTNANAPAGSAKFIGRVADSGGLTTVFVDLGNKKPGFSTGFLVERGTMKIMELCPYSSKTLAVVDMSTPKAYYRFATLAVPQPRKNSLMDNMTA